MTDEQDRLEKAKSLAETALTTAVATNFTANPKIAIGTALTLGAAIILVLLELAEDVREVRRLCEDEARCDRCDCG